MNKEFEGPRNKEENKSTTEAKPDKKKEGDDILSEKDSTNSRLDEKVIVNEQSSQKIVNAPSQTEPHPVEGGERVDEI